MLDLIDFRFYLCVDADDRRQLSGPPDVFVVPGGPISPEEEKIFEEKKLLQYYIELKVLQIPHG